MDPRIHTPDTIMEEKGLNQLWKPQLTFLAKYLKSSVFRIRPDLQSTLKNGLRQFTTTLESCGKMEMKLQLNIKYKTENQYNSKLL